MKKRKPLNNNLNVLWGLFPVYEQSSIKPLDRLWETLPSQVLSATWQLKGVLDRV